MHRLVGILLILVSAASFGAMAIFARLAYASGAAPVTVLFLRFAIASAIMLGLMLVRRAPFPRGRVLLGLVAMGAVGYVGQSFSYFTAVSLASAGLVALLLYLYPVLVMAFGALLFKERITPARVFALLLALAGAALTIGPTGGGRPLGIALGLAAAVFYAGYILAGSRIMRRVPAIPASTVIIGTAALVYGGLVALAGPRLPATAEGWLAILCLAVISTVVSIATFLAGLERIGPTAAAMISTVEPAITVGLAALVLDERVGALTLLGGALILAAVLIVTAGEPVADAARPPIGPATRPSGDSAAP